MSLRTTYYFSFSFFLFFAILSPTFAQDTTLFFTQTYSIQSGSDDVEELEDGSIYTNSTDLELIYDGEDQIVGLHFEELELAQGEEIITAYLQFTTDEISLGTCDLQIRAEAADYASSFTTGFQNLSNRTLTDSMVNWSPPEWTSFDESAAAQRSPDLAAVLQEVVDRPNWQQGNAVNLLINGSGERTAHAYEGDAEKVAKLEVTTSLTFSNSNGAEIYINELVAKNTELPDEYGETDDWVELYNGNNVGVLLENVFMSDDAAHLGKWTMEEPLLLAPQSFTLFWMDDAPEQGKLHAPFKLSSDGESVYLSQLQGTDTVIIDEVTFGSLSENVSYGRATDGDSTWVQFGNTSPAASNNGNNLFLDASVDFSLASGFYETGTPLTLTCSDSTASIKVTLDGSAPDENSLNYSNVLSLDNTMLIRAVAYKSGYISNEPQEGFYLVNGNHELPVLQISIAPELLWSDENGMYVSGTNGEFGNCSNDITRNWNREWERPMSMRYFEPDGTEAFHLNAGIKIAGGCSRGFAMKPFNVFLRKDEYGDKEVDYQLFQQTDLTKFKRFKLRSSGNDFPNTMVRDASIQAMLYGEVDIDQMAYEPVVVYLNGEYFGFYGMREFYNKHYIEAHHGVDKDSLDMMKNPMTWTEVKEGDQVAWEELRSFIRNNTLQDLGNYDYVTNQIDINEYLNYHIAEMYIGNYDWPGNNVTVWRDRNNGKWRWMLYDLDVSSGYAQWSPATVDFNSILHATNTSGMAWPNGPESTLFFRKLLENAYFKQEFSQRTCTFAQTIFAPERATHFVDSLTARVSSEVPAFLNKFNNVPADWKQWQDFPLGGSINSWNNNLNTLKSFFDNRLPFTLSHYENYFGYEGHFKLRINYDADTKGKVVFHLNEMKIPYEYEGEYFKNVPILIKAIPEEGYYFSHWEETGQTTAVLNFQANADQILTPIFLLNGTTPVSTLMDKSVFEVFPVPVKNSFTLRYAEENAADFLLRVYNVTGILVFEKNLRSSSDVQELVIDVSDWGRGIYFLKGVAGEKSFLEKVVLP